MKCRSWNQKESGLIDSVGDMLECEMFCLLTLLVIERNAVENRWKNTSMQHRWDEYTANLYTYSEYHSGKINIFEL
jgi:hypothetical protein